MAEGTGSRVQLRRATLAPNGRTALIAIGIVGALMTGFIAIQGWRTGNLKTVWAAMGFVAFFGLVLALLVSAATGAANDAVIAFTRRAMAGDASSLTRAAG